jgi:predicted NBD/HSP70 family sugar kinase
MGPESTTGVRFGIDLGGTKIELIALDRTGRELLRRRIATPRNDYPATVEAMARLLEAAEPVQRVARLALATAGLLADR